MGGCSSEGDWEFPSPKTLLLVGKTGNGKSSTGNSLLGEQKFQSKCSSSGVTQTSLLEAVVLQDGQIINVIDTPGMFDSSVKPEFIGKEILRCVNMSSDGIHAFLYVLSVCSRFSEEEEAAISSLVTLFGTRIYDYMIVVFTGGDELEEEGKTLEDCLCGCSSSLKQILFRCGNRRVLFDNRTKDQTKKASQVHQLLSLVDMVLKNNGGRPYSNEIFTEFKKGAEKLEAEKETKGYTEQQMLQMRQEHFMKMIGMVLSLVVEERAARLKVEKEAKSSRKKQENEIAQLKEKLKKLEEQKEEGGGCVIS